MAAQEQTKRLSQMTELNKYCFSEGIDAECNGCYYKGYSTCPVQKFENYVETYILQEGRTRDNRKSK